MTVAAMPYEEGEVFVAHGLFLGIMIPDWVERLGISSSAKRLYGGLCRFQGKNGRCYPW